MNILVTGSDGFIGKNLLMHLMEMPEIKVLRFSRKSTKEELSELITDADAIIHLAGTNRSLSSKDFATDNTKLTASICRKLINKQIKIPILFSSSTHADSDTLYGNSKKDSENILQQYSEQTNAPIYIYRLPNVFGKWCKPNYNSVVATFCHNIANNLPINIHNSSTELRLVHVDDVINDFIQVLQNTPSIEKHSFRTITPEYKITVGELAKYIEIFRDSRKSLTTFKVGSGLLRALYSTYVSYLPITSFTYNIPQHTDQRGIFAEVLKTPDAGQFSFFTAHPGITRGCHYHHTKTEKFLVVRGKARFKFQHTFTKETLTLETDETTLQIVETIPGWAHKITNIGTKEMVVILWANEIFRYEKPDTYTYKL